MASQHSSDKKPITVWIKSALVKRLDEMAKEYGLSRAALLTLWILQEKAALIFSSFLPWVIYKNIQQTNTTPNRKEQP